MKKSVFEDFKIIHGIYVERPELADAATKALFSTCPPPFTFSVLTRQQINFRFLLHHRRGVIGVVGGGGRGEDEGRERGLVPLQLLVFRHAPSFAPRPVSPTPGKGDKCHVPAYCLKFACFTWPTSGHMWCRKLSGRVLEAWAPPASPTSCWQGQGGTRRNPPSHF